MQSGAFRERICISLGLKQVRFIHHNKWQISSEWRFHALRYCEEVDFQYFVGWCIYHLLLWRLDSHLTSFSKAWPLLTQTYLTWAVLAQCFSVQRWQWLRNYQRFPTSHGQTIDKSSSSHTQSEEQKKCPSLLEEISKLGSRHLLVSILQVFE